MISHETEFLFKSSGYHDGLLLMLILLLGLDPMWIVGHVADVSKVHVHSHFMFRTQKVEATITPKCRQQWPHPHGAEKDQNQYQKGFHNKLFTIFILQTHCSQHKFIYRC
jgi:hypothetical protein